MPDEKKPKLSPTDAYMIVVEDNANNLIILLRLLTLIGVKRFNWLTSGKEMITFIRAMSTAEMAYQPDLILLDIGLPGEDGYSVLKELRADPKFQTTKVVAVTANCSTEEMHRAKLAGFDGFIGKPINALRFPEYLLRILDGKSVWELN